MLDRLLGDGAWRTDGDRAAPDRLATSDIVAARAEGRALATQLGFSRTDATLIATAISEIARNILVHAGSGRGRAAAGDRGPPLRPRRRRHATRARASATSRRRCSEGYRHRAAASASGCPGAQADHGRVRRRDRQRPRHDGRDGEVARARRARAPRASGGAMTERAVLEWALRAPARPPEEAVCGDRALVRRGARPRRCSSAIDGLGHGPEAARAARRARSRPSGRRRRRRR